MLGIFAPDAPDSNATLLDDPKTTFHVLGLQNPQETLGDLQNMGFILGLQSKHNEPRIIRRRVGPNIGKPQVEREECSSLALTNRGELILCASEFLVMHRDCIVSSFIQQIRELDRKVLIDLELHSL